MRITFTADVAATISDPEPVDHEFKAGETHDVPEFAADLFLAQGVAEPVTDNE